MKKKLDSTCNLEFYNLLKSMNNGFYDYYRTHLLKKDGKKIYGTMFKLKKPLTDDDKNIILSYPNTLLYIAQSEYAPELKHNCVLVLDRKIRNIA